LLFLTKGIDMDYTRVFLSIDECYRVYVIERAALVGETPGQFISTLIRQLDFDDSSGGGAA
jgi:hypothetical protein